MTRSRDQGPGDDAPEDELATLLRLDSEAGPARALSERELLVLGDRIERQFAQRQRGVRRFSSRRLVLAGGLFAASAAAAVYGVGLLTRQTPEPGAAAPPTAAGSASSSTLPQLTPPRPELESPREPPAGTESGEPEPGLLPVAPPAPPAGLSELEERPAESQLTVQKSNTSKLARPVPSRSVVADRLAAANALRARHRYREALAVYLQVIEIAPSGMQASVARVAAAEMQLEQLGDVAGAERLYREAKTQGGELVAEAQFGLARVARARGDVAAERQGLQDFLARHPESPLVSAARRRLQALGAR